MLLTGWPVACSYVARPHSNLSAARLLEFVLVVIRGHGTTSSFNNLMQNGFIKFVSVDEAWPRTNSSITSLQFIFTRREENVVFTIWN